MTPYRSSSSEGEFNRDNPFSGKKDLALDHTPPPALQAIRALSTSLRVRPSPVSFQGLWRRQGVITVARKTPVFRECRLIFEKIPA
jgi:hypothetical protein